MIRPLTAADRTPEAGDVLTMIDQPEPLTVAKVTHGPRDTVEWYDRLDDRWGTGFSCQPWWHYVSRADGGPVTIEDA